MGYFTAGFIMADLEPQDLMHLNAAEGWLGFGNVIEADKELKQITPAMQRHPEVLARWYEMFAKAECWPKCEEVAEEIIRLGVGVRIPKTRWPERLPEAVQTIEESPSYRLAAEGLMPKVRAEEGPKKSVEVLEDLVKNWKGWKAYEEGKELG
jgi:hypothetical protein